MQTGGCRRVRPKSLPGVDGPLLAQLGARAPSRSACGEPCPRHPSIQATLRGATNGSIRSGATDLQTEAAAHGRLRPPPQPDAVDSDHLDHIDTRRPLPHLASVLATRCRARTTPCFSMHYLDGYRNLTSHGTHIFQRSNETTSLRKAIELRDAHNSGNLRRARFDILASGVVQ